MRPHLHLRNLPRDVRLVKFRRLDGNIELLLNLCFADRQRLQGRVKDLWLQLPSIIRGRFRPMNA